MRIRATALASLALAVLAVSGHRAQGLGEHLFRVRIQAAATAEVKARLTAAGYDVLVADLQQASIDLAVTRDEWQTLASAGYEVTLIDRGRPLRDSVQAAVPASYRDLQGILDRMQEIAAAYPAIARVVDLKIGRAHV